MWWALLVVYECPSSSVFLKNWPPDYVEAKHHSAEINTTILRQECESVPANETRRMWTESFWEPSVPLTHVLFFPSSILRLPDPQTQGKDAPIILQSWGDKEDKSFHPKDRGAQVWEKSGSLKASQSHLSVHTVHPSRLMPKQLHFF